MEHWSVAATSAWDTQPGDMHVVLHHDQSLSSVVVAAAVAGTEAADQVPV